KQIRSAVTAVCVSLWNWLNTDMASIDRLSEEYLGFCFEIPRIIGGIKSQLSVFRAGSLNFGVAMQIILQAAGDDRSLGDDRNTFGYIFLDDGQQKRIVCTGQYNRINLIRLLQELANIFLYKIVRAFGIDLVIFYQRNPKRTVVLKNFDFGIKLMDFDFIRFRFNSSGSCQNTNFIGLGVVVYDLRRRTDNTEHFLACRKVIML